MRISSRFVGRLAWRAPVWLQEVGQHRRTLIGCVVGLALLATGAFFAHRWWEGRPKPQRVAVTAEPIGVAPIVEEKDPEPRPALVVDFSESAAPLAKIGKPAGPAVWLEPAVGGHWRWESDTRLVFTPEQGWPAEMKYRVHLEKGAVAPHVLLDHPTVEVETPAFAGKIEELTFYQDPTDPAVKQAVATLEFTHAVDHESLEREVRLAMLGGAPVFGNTGAKPFTITYARHDRRAFLRTVSLTLPERADFLRVTLPKGIRTTEGRAETRAEVVDKLAIPDVYSLLRIDSVTGTMVTNDAGEPEQFLIVNTTAAVNSAELAKNLSAVILPHDKPATEADPVKRNYAWASAAEIDDSARQQAQPVALQLVPGEHETAQIHTFKIVVAEEGFLAVKVTKGLRTPGGFTLRDDFESVLAAPMPPREITIAGDGGVLALSGEKKLLVRSRGVREIEYVIARIPAEAINHLVSQTTGDFQSPEFRGWTFNEENIARISTERQRVAVANRIAANETVFDFSPRLGPATDGGPPLQGLFLLRAREFREPKKKADPQAGSGEADEDDDDSDDDSGSAAETHRLILVTDLGLLVKENANGSRDLFIASIQAGQPCAGVQVEVLAKNGLALAKAETDAEGHATFPPLLEAEHERRPVAFVARLGNDVAFMPYHRADREVDLSRFDIGGVENATGAELEAFAFTERGIYRPGDTVHAGFLVKRRDWGGHVDGLPLEMEVVDASGRSVQVQPLQVPASGFVEATCETSPSSASGEWRINLRLLRNGKRTETLGATSFTVKEFLPDRMKMETRLSVPTTPGWIEPGGVKAVIALANLYGTPATTRLVQARMELSPAGFGFEQFPDYCFFDRAREGQKAPETQKVELGDFHTDERGEAQIDLGLERFADATYALAVTVEGYEAGDGRSITRRISALVSNLPYVIGSKPDGDLAYVKAGTKRLVNFIAVNRTLERTAAENLQLEVREQRHVSVLKKQENGSFEYESVLQEKSVRRETASISAAGLDYALPAEAPGDYILELRDGSGARVSRLSYTVVGLGTKSRSLEKNAELEVKLSKPAYGPGEEIEVSITAPYTGFGLITLERDRVYAQHWFRLTQNSGVEKITLPPGLEGTGYVQVSFIRALDSPEVFMSPLSSGVVPFQAALGRRKMSVELHVPAKSRPGEPLPIRFKTDRPGKIAIFAVDEGILQVTNYAPPDPLAFFFRKQALLVKTAQIVDLILPEFSMLHAAAAGGDGEAKELNPFRRITEKPVVFWSGVIDAGPDERAVRYDVPDYFNGTLKIMAVALAPDGAGSATTEALVRGPFVLTPTVPTFVAPGDEFVVGVTVARDLVTNAGAVTLRAEGGAALEISAGPEAPIALEPGRETTVTFHVKAREVLGSATLQFTAAAGEESSQLRSTLSIRPPRPLVTTVRGGNWRDGAVDVPITRDLRPEFRDLEAVVAGTPLGLARGLQSYLQNYPNGCTEQLTSGGFCRLMLAGEADFALPREEAAAQLAAVYQKLRTRQSDQGGFGYWNADAGDGIEFLTPYVAHFLLEAKDAGFAPPDDLLQNALKRLRVMAALEPHDLAEARTVAYGIYVLTRGGVVTTNLILNLRDTLDRQWPRDWPHDLTAVDLAGALALLQKNAEAAKLIDGYQPGALPRTQCSDFVTQLGADAQYLAILGRHFPDKLAALAPEKVRRILQPIGEGDFNTLSAAYAIVALKSMAQAAAAGELRMSSLSADQVATELAAGGSGLRRLPFPAGVAALRFEAKNLRSPLGAFYQVIETGFDRALPTAPESAGLEVQREYRNAHNEPVTQVALGEVLTVVLHVRSLNGATVTNAAVLDLLPGGFEIARESLEPGAHTESGWEFTEVREDRVIFFGDIETNAREIRYQIKPCQRGTFTVPPVFAESMYNRGIHGCGVADRMVVAEGPR